MNWLEDIENDIVNNKLDDNTFNLLYGVHNFIDINSIDDFVNHIITVTHIEELISHILNNINHNKVDIILPDITKYSNNMYDIHFHERSYMYEYRTTDSYKGFDILINFIQISDSIKVKISLANTIRSIDILEYVVIYYGESNVQRSVDSIMKIIKDAIYYNTNKYFGIDLIKFMQTHICTHGSKTIRIHDDILKIINSIPVNNIDNILNNTTNVDYKIGIIMVYILKNPKLLKYITVLIDNSNILTYFIRYVNITLNELSLSNPFYKILNILVQHNILDYISIFDFIDGIMYYTKLPDNIKKEYKLI